MKNVAKTIAFVWISWLGGNTNLWAQAPPIAQNNSPSSSSSPSNSVPIAVVDITNVFTNHEGFKQKLAAMRVEVRGFGAQITEENKALVKMRDRLQTFTPGSPDFKKLEEELARQASDHEVRGKLKQKDVMDQEAKIYFETYQEIVREVAKMADAYGINLVLKYEGSPIDPSDRNAIMLGLNR